MRLPRLAGPVALVAALALALTGCRLSADPPEVVDERIRVALEALDPAIVEAEVESGLDGLERDLFVLLVLDTEPPSDELIASVLVTIVDESRPGDFSGVEVTAALGSRDGDPIELAAAADRLGVERLVDQPLGGIVTSRDRIERALLP